MEIGLKTFRDLKQVETIQGMLMLPFAQVLERYAINHRW